MRVLTFSTSIFCVVSLACAAQTVSVIAENGNAGFNHPNAPLLVGQHDMLYGTSLLGGQRSNSGFVFALSPPAKGQTAWKSTMLYAFAGGTDGASPTAGLVSDKQGNLFGTTQDGGTSNGGIVFELSPPAPGQSSWTKTTLVAIPNQSNSGIPAGRLAIDPAGNLYGVSQGYSHVGSVWEVVHPTPPSGAWMFETLYTFTGGADGEAPGPYAGPLRDHNGFLFGTTQMGGAGANAQGTVWRLNPPSRKHANWTETTLATFNGINGTYATGGLIKDLAGDLYGTASGGGATGNGVVYELATSGTSYVFNIIYSFGTSNGSAPETALLLHNGILYGTTAAVSGYGGTGNGTLFSLQNVGGAWQENTFYTFPDGSQGGLPGQLAMGYHGNVFGTTAFGGTANCSGYQPTGCGTAFVFTVPDH